MSPDDVERIKNNITPRHARRRPVAAGSVVESLFIVPLVAFYGPYVMISASGCLPLVI